MRQKTLTSFVKQNKQPPREDSLQIIKICTLNVNSIRARKELLLDWVRNRDNDLDILCLQELKVVESDFPYEDFERLGFRCEVFGQKGFNGVAICSKMLFESVKKGFGDLQWDKESRTLWAKIHGINLVSVYAPHGDLRGTDKYNYKLDWYNRFAGFLKQNFSSEQKLIIVGDFNVAKSDLDVFGGELARDGIGTMDEEREAFQKLLDWGLVDSFRELHPEKKQFTWWDYIGGAIWKDEGMRLDYVLCTEALKNRILEVEVDMWPRRRKIPTPSDHAPVIAMIKL